MRLFGPKLMSSPRKSNKLVKERNGSQKKTFKEPIRLFIKKKKRLPKSIIKVNKLLKTMSLSLPRTGLRRYKTKSTKRSKNSGEFLSPLKRKILKKMRKTKKKMLRKLSLKTKKVAKKK